MEKASRLAATVQVGGQRNVGWWATCRVVAGSMPLPVSSGKGGMRAMGPCVQRTRMLALLCGQHWSACCIALHGSKPHLLAPLGNDAFKSDDAHTACHHHHIVFPNCCLPPALLLPRLSIMPRSSVPSLTSTRLHGSSGHWCGDPPAAPARRLQQQRQQAARKMRLRLLHPWWVWRDCRRAGGGLPAVAPSGSRRCGHRRAPVGSKRWLLLRTAM